MLVVTGADLFAHGKQHFAIGVASRAAGIGGALGASFESQSYVRHVTYVDEELA